MKVEKLHTEGQKSPSTTGRSRVCWLGLGNACLRCLGSRGLWQVWAGTIPYYLHQKPLIQWAGAAKLPAKGTEWGRVLTAVTTTCRGRAASPSGAMGFAAKGQWCALMQLLKATPLVKCFFLLLLLLMYFQAESWHADTTWPERCLCFVFVKNELSFTSRTLKSF